MVESIFRTGSVSSSLQNSRHVLLHVHVEARTWRAAAGLLGSAARLQTSSLGKFVQEISALGASRRSPASGRWTKRQTYLSKQD